MSWQIATLRRTTTASPSQWEGALDDGRPIYIRYRWGWLSVKISICGESIREVVQRPAWFDEQVGHKHDPMIELHEVLQATGLRLSPQVAHLALPSVAVRFGE